MKIESNTNCMFETEPGYNILHKSQVSTIGKMLTYRSYKTNLGFKMLGSNKIITSSCFKPSIACERKLFFQFFFFCFFLCFAIFVTSEGLNYVYMVILVIFFNRQ